MHLEIQTHRKNPIGVLRSSFRTKDGRVRHRSFGPITGLSLDQLKLLQAAFRSQVVPTDSPEALRTSHAREFGACAALLALAKDLQLPRILGQPNDPNTRALLAMIIGKLLYSGSKLSLVNLFKDTCLWEVCGVTQHGERPDGEAHCYRPRDERLRRQGAIQKKLARRHLQEGALILYDITSVYFEGDYAHSELVAFGHAKAEGKRGCPQVMIGLICDAQGCPVGVEVFAVHTKDETTVPDKIAQIRQSFGIQDIIFVGDRGMITQANDDKLKGATGLSTITALTHPQILALIDQKHIQAELFDETKILEMIDPQDDTRRLCLCRNPQSAAKEAATRQALLEKTRQALDTILAGTSKKSAGAEQVGQRVGKVIERYKMGKFVRWSLVDIEVVKGKPAKSREGSFDQEAIERESLIDGCTIVACDVPQERLDSEQTVAAYKSLSQVEQAFRNLKTVQIDLRPVYHHRDDRIQAHVFLCMLSYDLQWHMKQRLSPLFAADGKHEERRWTFAGVLQRLKSLGKSRAQLGGVEFDHIDTPDEEQSQILGLLGVRLPTK